jgi:hypothetical protein
MCARFVQHQTTKIVIYAAWFREDLLSFQKYCCTDFGENDGVSGKSGSAKLFSDPLGNPVIGIEHEGFVAFVVHVRNLIERIATCGFALKS